MTPAPTRQDRRSSPRQPAAGPSNERRKRLRTLDRALLRELRWTGALNLDEFEAHLRRTRLASIDASSLTLRDWWLDGLRRGLIERHPDASLPGAYRITDAGERHLRRREVIETLGVVGDGRLPRGMVLALMRSGLAGVVLAAGLARPQVGQAAVATVVAILLVLLVVEAMVRLTLPLERRMDLWVLRRQVSVLEGRRRPLRTRLSEGGLP